MNKLFSLGVLVKILTTMIPFAAPFLYAAKPDSPVLDPLRQPVGTLISGQSLQ